MPGMVIHEDGSIEAYEVSPEEIDIVMEIVDIIKEQCLKSIICNEIVCYIINSGTICMTVYVLTMNRKLNVSRKHQNHQDSEFLSNSSLCNKLTARIIQCIVPHKLIVLDLLNFCYHKLHVQFHRGVLSRVSACQYLVPLTLLDIQGSVLASVFTKICGSGTGIGT